MTNVRPKTKRGVVLGVCLALAVSIVAATAYATSTWSTSPVGITSIDVEDQNLNGTGVLRVNVHFVSNPITGTGCANESSFPGYWELYNGTGYNPDVLKTLLTTLTSAKLAGRQVNVLFTTGLCNNNYPVIAGVRVQ